MSVYKKAYDLSKLAALEGFDWDDWTGSFDKVREELDEVGEEAEAMQGKPHAALIEEFGDLILSIMSLARHLQVDPEEACNVGAEKFKQRFAEYKVFTQALGINIQDINEAEHKKLWLAYKNSLTN